MFDALIKLLLGFTEVSILAFCLGASVTLLPLLYLLGTVFHKDFLKTVAIILGGLLFLVVGGVAVFKLLTTKLSDIGINDPALIAIYWGCGILVILVYISGLIFIGHRILELFSNFIRTRK